MCAQEDGYESAQGYLQKAAITFWSLRTRMTTATHNQAHQALAGHAGITPEER